jgi:hypothetical protein
MFTAEGIGERAFEHFSTWLTHIPGWKESWHILELDELGDAKALKPPLDGLAQERLELGEDLLDWVEFAMRAQRIKTGFHRLGAVLGESVSLALWSALATFCALGRERVAACTAVSP